MEKRYEELSKEVEKDFNGLEVISYEKMVELLNNQERNIMIWFYDFKDVFFSGNEYHYVEVRDLDNDKHFTYKAPDQNDELIEQNLLKALDESKIEPQFSIFEGEYCVDYFCSIGNNKISFPISVAKRIIKEFNESAKRQAEFESKKPASKTIALKPEKQDLGELPFEI